MAAKKQTDAMSKRARQMKDQTDTAAAKAADALAKKATGDAEAEADAALQGEHYPAGDVIEAATQEHAIVTTETRSLTGRSFEAQRKSDNPRHYAVGRDKAYGQSTKEEHRRSGYILPDSFYEGESTALAQHKMPGNGHAEGGAAQE